MKLFFFLFFSLLLTHCSKPKTVLICGDHVCINKAEAEQYFEENLTIEVKIIDEKIHDNIDLVELNLQENIKGKRRVQVVSKSETDKTIKELSKNEIIQIKEKIKNKKKKKKIIKKDKIIDQKEIKKEKKVNVKNTEKKSKIVNKVKKDLVDICTIIEKCSIDEISRYLEDQSKTRGFPDITTRQ